MSKAKWDSVWNKQRRLTKTTRHSVIYSLIYYLREKYFSTTFARFARKRIGAGLILEVGCGTAQCSLKILRNEVEVIGADFSASALQLAKKYVQGYKRIKFIVTDAFNLPFNENTFDAVWSIGLLEHFERSRRALALEEMRRVVKPGGTVMGIVPYKYGPLGVLNYSFRRLRRAWIWEDETPLDNTELYRLFNRAGLQEVEVKKMHDTFLMFLGATGEKSTTSE